MDIYVDKLPLQILYFIRQAAKISFSDLCKKGNININSMCDSVSNHFLCCLSNLQSSNFIETSYKNSNNNAGLIDSADDESYA